MIVAQLSDPHIVAPGELLGGDFRDPLRRDDDDIPVLHRHVRGKVLSRDRAFEVQGHPRGLVPASPDEKHPLQVRVGSRSAGL